MLFATEGKPGWSENILYANFERNMGCHSQIFNGRWSSWGLHLWYQWIGASTYKQALTHATQHGFYQYSAATFDPSYITHSKVLQSHENTCKCLWEVWGPEFIWQDGPDCNDSIFEQNNNTLENVTKYALKAISDEMKTSDLNDALGMPMPTLRRIGLSALLPLQ